LRSFEDPELAVPLLLAAALLLAVLVLGRVWARVVRRAAPRRHAGYQLMDALKAYTVWVDWHRDEAMQHQPPESVSVPAPLAKAVQIKDQHFPELARLMQQLLQTHRQLMQYLWEDNLLRNRDSAPVRPHYADPRYHQLRDTQDAALDSLFAKCRELIGRTESGWRRTRSDFSFSSALGGASSRPASG
jgi:hypothetical protein